MKSFLEKLKKEPRLIVIMIISLFLLILLPYLGGIIYYRSHFLNNTFIEGIDVSGMNLEKANEALAQLDPSVTVIQKNINGFTSHPQKIQLNDIDPQSRYDASYILEKQNPLRWFISQSNEHDAGKVSGNFDEAKAASLVDQLYCLNSENTRLPVDAHLDIVDGQVEIINENDGSYIDPVYVKETVTSALRDMYTGRDSDVVDLREAYGKALITADNPQFSEKKKIFTDTISKTITININDETVTLKDDQLAELISSANSDPIINEDKVDNLIVELSKQYESLNRAKLKQDLSAALLSNSDQNITANFDKITSSLVEVDISEQTLWYFEDGVTLLTSPVVTGNPAITEQTPTGDYEVRRKSTDTYLMGRDYLEHVDYWIGWDQTGRVYGFHDACWRDEFGGDIYTYDPSRGCVNMPTDKVGLLFQMVDIGTKVNVHE